MTFEGLREISHITGCYYDQNNDKKKIVTLIHIEKKSKGINIYLFNSLNHYFGIKFKYFDKIFFLFV